jgi:hypothetical protein
VALLAAGCVTSGPGGGGSPPTWIDTVVVDGQLVSVSGPTGSTVAVAVADPATHPLAAGYFALGALDIDVTGVASGSVVRVTVTVQNPVDTVRKLIDGTWEPFPHDGTTGATISTNGTTVTLDLRDGGRGDTDGAADGTVVDPVMMGADTGAVPTMTVGQPFAHQLQATGGTGEITWDVLSGPCGVSCLAQHGLALDPSGLLSGTPSAMMTNPALVRVQAADGTSSATKLLALVALDGAGPTSSAALLPTGTRITLRTSPNYFGNDDFVGGYVQDRYADATMAPLTTSSVASMADGRFGESFGNPAGTLVALPGDSGDPWFLPTLEVLDADSGASVVALQPPESGPAGITGGSFSPDGAHLAVRSGSGVGWIYDTGTWVMVRTFETNPYGPLIWSPDSTELANSQGYAGGVEVSSATNPGADHMIAITNSSCGGGFDVTEWSATDRLAVRCGNSVITVAADGTDERAVADPTDCNAFPCSIYWDPRFSPSGSQLVMSEATYPEFGLPPVSRAVIAADVPDATLTPVTNPSPAGSFTAPMSWTTTTNPAVGGVESWVHITSGEVPVMTVGEPFAHQLTASWAGPTPTWSVVSGTLPAGITLAPSGVLSGTPPPPVTPTGPRLTWVRVRATSDQASDTKLLDLRPMMASAQSTSTGQVLTEGTRIAVGESDSSGAAPWFGHYLADGTLSRVATTSVASFAGLSGGGSGAMVVTFAIDAAAQKNTGPVEVIDGDTGARITTLEASPSFEFGGASFSPNDAYLSFRDPAAGTTRIYDTATWTVVRTIPNLYGYRWSPHSDELATGPVSVANPPSSTFSVFSATDPAADRTFSVEGHSCSAMEDWSVNDRLALRCSIPNAVYSNGLVTVSAGDADEPGGTDVRGVVTTGCTIPVTLPCPGGFLAARFSPSGSHLVLTSWDFTAFSPSFSYTTRIAVAPDAPNATLTPITNDGVNVQAMPMRWE